MSRAERARAALSPLCVEHLQELRDFGVPQTVQTALTLAMRVVTGSPEATWHDAATIWMSGGFAGGLRRFIALMRAYEAGEAPDPAWEAEVRAFVCSGEARAISPDSQAAGAAIRDFLTALVD